MPFRPPLNLDQSCHTSGTLPDGRTLPLAWDLITGKIMMKVAPFFPWNRADNNKSANKLYEAGGVYLAVTDDWFRGVWVEAPQQLFDADYTRKQQLELSRGTGSRATLDSVTGRFALGLTAGGGGMQKAGSTTIEGEYEEVGDDDDDDDDDEAEAEGESEGEGEEATTAKRPKKKGKARR